MGSCFEDRNVNPVYTVNSSPVSGLPFSVSAWLYYGVPKTANGIALANFSSSAGLTNQFSCFVNIAGNFIARSRSGATTADASSSGVVPLRGTWVHATFVFASTRSRSIYLNGVLSNSNTTTVNSFTPNIFRLCQLGGESSLATATLGAGSFLSELCLWNSALSARAVYDLYQGRSPLSFKDEGLLKYFFPRGRVPGADDCLLPGTSYWDTATGFGFSDFEPPIFKPRKRSRVGAATLITLIADVINSTGSAIDPSRSLGSLSISNPVVSGTSTAITPSSSLGALSLSVDTASGLSDIYIPAIVFGALTLSTAVASGSSTAVSSTVVLGALSLSVDEVTSTSSVVDCGLSPPPLTVPVDTAIATASIDNPSIYYAKPVLWDDGGITLLTDSNVDYCTLTVENVDTCCLVSIFKEPCVLVQSQVSTVILVNINSGEVESQR